MNAADKDASNPLLSSPQLTSHPNPLTFDHYKHSLPRLHPAAVETANWPAEAAAPTALPALPETLQDHQHLPGATETGNSAAKAAYSPPAEGKSYHSEVGEMSCRLEGSQGPGRAGRWGGLAFGGRSRGGRLVLWRKVVLAFA